MEQDKTIIQPFQIENYVQNLQCLPVDEILSNRWIVQSCRMIQLGIQMVLESTQNKDPEVLTQINLHEKNVVFTWELLSAEAWRQNVLPILLKDANKFVIKTNLPLQLLFHAEVAISGVLENMISEDESSIDCLILDIVDWAIRQMVEVSNKAVKDKDNLVYSAKEELDKYKNNKEHCEKELMFREINRDFKRSLLLCCCRAIGILQQVSMKRETLPLCVTSRLLQNHDVPQLISTLINERPWESKHEGNMYFFEEGQWTLKPKSNLSIGKVEVQLWMILFSLLLQHENLPAYEMTSGRKTSLLSIQTRLNIIIERDLPDLEPLGKFMSTLSLWNPPPPKNLPLVTTMPQIGEAPYKSWINKWNDLAKYHCERVFNPSQETLNALATRFATAFDLEALEYLLPDTPTCAQCGEPASQRCSRCKTHWYCRRSCQVKHWKKHKSLCDLVKENSGKEEPSKEITDIQ